MDARGARGGRRGGGEDLVRVGEEVDLLALACGEDEHGDERRDDARWDATHVASVRGRPEAVKRRHLRGHGTGVDGGPASGGACGVVPEVIQAGGGAGGSGRSTSTSIPPTHPATKL